MKANVFKSELELLDEILAELKTLNLKLKQKKETDTANDTLLDTADVLHLSKITARTAQRWRKEGKLKFLKIGKKIYYRKKDIEQLTDSLR